MVAQENLKQLTDLVILGFDDLFSIVETKYGNADLMEEKGLGKAAYQIFTVLPQIQVIEINSLICINNLNLRKF
jgi:hypothetical protein